MAGSYIGSRPGQLFLGSTPAPIRSYLQDLFGSALSRYERLVIPCAGKLAVAEVAVAAGWPANRIDCSDVSLFSAVIGYHCSGQPIKSLGVTCSSLDIDVTDAAEILYAMKVLNVRAHGTTYRDKQLLRELERGRDAAVLSLRDSLKVLGEVLAGVSYQNADMMNEVHRVLDDKKTLLYVNPPAYSRGYEKMFDTAGALTWDEPPYTQWKPKKHGGVLWQRLKTAEALSLLYHHHARLEDEDRQHSVFALEKGWDKTRHLVCNRPKEARRLARPSAKPRAPTAVRSAGKPVFAYRDEVTPETTIEFQRVDRDVAMYYRDLWAHRLGVTNAEHSFLMLLDGKVASVVGVKTDTFRRFQNLYLFEQYGFSPPHERFRLNRLLMMCVTSSALLDLIPKTGHLAVRTPVGIKTTCLTQWPELKTNRGIMKLVSRKVWGNGMYHLSYEAEFVVRSFEEVLKLWLEKELNRLRQSRQAPAEKRSPTSGKGSRSGSSTSTRSGSKTATRASRTRGRSTA